MITTTTKELLLDELKANPEDEATRLVYADFLEESGDDDGAARMRETSLFLYEELSDKAQEKAREWYMEGNLNYDWWDAVYEDADRVAEILGITIDRKTIKLMNGGTRQEPEIWFQGFYTQGSGSAFSGVYHYAKGSRKKIREFAPQDEVLHSIADRLYAEQKTACFSISARIEARRDTSVIVVSDCERGAYDEKCFDQALEDFNHWIFSQLEAEYEYRNSDEVLADEITSNEYTFDADGNRED